MLLALAEYRQVGRVFGFIPLCPSLGFKSFQSCQLPSSVEYLLYAGFIALYDPEQGQFRALCLGFRQ